MNQLTNVTLIFGALLSFAGALIHVGVAIWGASLMRFFRAPDSFVSATEGGSTLPALGALVVAVLLIVAAVYALSGAGILPTLPLLKPGLIVITGIYLARGFAVVPLAMARPDRVVPIVRTSVIVLGFGAVHLLGLVQVWRKL
jgi:hypothetical protein